MNAVVSSTKAVFSSVWSRFLDLLFAIPLRYVYIINGILAVGLIVELLVIAWAYSQRPPEVEANPCRTYRVRDAQDQKVIICRV